MVVLPHLTDVEVREGWLKSVIWGREGLLVRRATPCQRLCLGDFRARTAVAGLGMCADCCLLAGGWGVLYMVAGGWVVSCLTTPCLLPHQKIRD